MLFLMFYSDSGFPNSIATDGIHGSTSCSPKSWNKSIHSLKSGKLQGTLAETNLYTTVYTKIRLISIIRQMGINLISKTGKQYVSIAYCMTIIINFIFCGFLLFFFFLKECFKISHYCSQLVTAHSNQCTVLKVTILQYSWQNKHVPDSPPLQLVVLCSIKPVPTVTWS